MSLYGKTFAQKKLDQGEYEQAVVEATKHADREPESPEPYHDRAKALALLNRYEEALSDYGKAIELDRAEGILHDGELDDGVFSTILAFCQSLSGMPMPMEEQLALLRRYPQLQPGGSHIKEAEEWALRFRGLLKTSFVKPRD